MTKDEAKYTIDLRYGTIKSAEALLEHSKAEAKTYPPDAVIHSYIPILEKFVSDLNKAQEAHIVKQLLSRVTR